MIRVLYVLLMCWLAMPAAAQTVDRTGGWRGVKVMPKDSCVVRLGNTVLDNSNWVLPYIVRDVNGQWLGVGDKVRGWVLRSHVLTMNEAPAYYSQLIASNPKNAQAYHRRALVWIEKGQLDRALHDTRESIQLKSTTAAYTTGGNIFLDQKDYDKAIGAYYQALRLDPHNALAYCNRGSAWYEKKQIEKALADYDKAIDIDPNFAVALCYRGVAWEDKQEHDKALADYTKAIKSDPKYARAYINRGWAWRGRKEYDKALADFNEAIRLNPKESDAQNALAWLYATCPDAAHRKGKQAVELALNASELSNWMSYEPVDTLAAAYAEIGDFNRAVKYQKQAIDLNPKEESFVKAAEERLALYEAQKPYRE